MSTPKSPTHSVLKIGTALTSVVVATLLVVLKTWAVAKTHSASMLASLVDSGMDILASLINFVSIVAATRPPDEDHRFGHGKAEALAGLFQALVIGASAAYLVYEALKRFIYTQPLESTGLGFGVMGVSLVATLVLTWWLNRVAKKTGSIALAADSLHYVSDVAANLAVMAALGLFYLTGSTIWDVLTCLGIAVVIVASAWKVGKSSVDILMDRELSGKKQRAIHLAMSEFAPEVISYHRLKTRHTGTHHVIEIHLVLPAELTFKEAHDCTDRVEAAIKNQFENTMVIAHYDPFDPKKAQDIDANNHILQQAPIDGAREETAGPGSEDKI